jgi:hypothetical protein
MIEISKRVLFGVWLEKELPAEKNLAVLQFVVDALGLRDEEKCISIEIKE